MPSASSKTTASRKSRAKTPPSTAPRCQTWTSTAGTNPRLLHPIPALPTPASSPHHAPHPITLPIHPSTPIPILLVPSYLRFLHLSRLPPCFGSAMVFRKLLTVNISPNKTSKKKPLIPGCSEYQLIASHHRRTVSTFLLLCQIAHLGTVVTCTLRCSFSGLGCRL